MSTEQPILARAIWFDDECDNDFIDNAAARGILVVPFDSNTDGLAHLRAHYKDFDVVILDAWGRIQSGSAKAEDPTALGHAKDELQELAIRFGYSIPQCIYSGHLEALDQVTGKARKFSKKSDNDLDAMFDWVLEQAEKRGVTTVQAMHADVFAVFEEDLLPEDKKWELIKLLKEIDTKDAAVMKANNALARTFIEPIMEGLHKQLGEQFMPSELIKGGRVNADGAYRFLTGQKLDITDHEGNVVKTFNGEKSRSRRDKSNIIPEHLGWMLPNIIKTPTFTGSHDYRDRHTHYAHRATVNVLCELLIWYHDLIMSKRK